MVTYDHSSAAASNLFNQATAAEAPAPNSFNCHTNFFSFFFFFFFFRGPFSHYYLFTIYLCYNKYT